MEVWTKRKSFRDRINRNFVKHQNSLRDRFLKASTSEFTYDVEIVQQVLEDYNDFSELLQKKLREEKQINNFLCDLPNTGQIIEIDELTRHADNKARAFTE
jgi:hypothetical protein